MAREVAILLRTREAAADLSASQFCAVILDNTGKINLPGAGAAAFGVLQNKPASGQQGGVMVYGLTRMIVGAGGTVTAGDKVMVDTAGAAVTATSTNFAIGFAEETGAPGTTIAVILIPSGKV